MGEECVHWAHFSDRRPLCFSFEDETPFTATRVQADVTCPKCKKYWEEEESQ